MINRKLSIALLAGMALPAVANADIKGAVTSVMIPSPKKDLAPVNGATPPRLRRTDSEQAGNEMTHFALFADGKSGIYFSMATELPNPADPTNPIAANHRVQLAAVPFTLTQDPTTKAVSAVADMTKAKFVTNNKGQEYRNAHHPSAFAIDNGNAICAEYNARINGANNTERYLQCFDNTGANILPQTKIYAKNNDDCSMNQDKASSNVVSFKTVGAKTVTKIVAWRGCNGNGQDDGWLQAYTITRDTTTGKATFAQQMDVSVCPREERSHGMCTVSAADPDTAICSWTEGNTQPQRDGAWLAAVNIADTVKGTNQQNAILWKQQIGGKQQLPNGQRTYAMRAMHDRIMTTDANGNLVPSDQIIYRFGQVLGNNNGNAKGGTYMSNMIGVIQATKTGPKFVIPMKDMQGGLAGGLLGLDGTHLGFASAMFGTTDKLQPGLVFIGGSHTGGAYPAQLRAVGLDTTAGTIKDLGMFQAGPYDRHLYSNYLGNNPGNQGRNYAGTQMIKNPFATGAAGEDAYLMLVSSTGKTTDDEQNAAIKLTAFLSVIPVAQAPMTATPPQGQGSGQGGGTGGGTGTGMGSGQGGTQPDPGTTTQPDPTTTQPADPGTSLGGCSTTGSTGGALTFLLVGMAAFIRRRK